MQGILSQDPQIYQGLKKCSISSKFFDILCLLFLCGLLSNLVSPVLFDVFSDRFSWINKDGFLLCFFQGMCCVDDIVFDFDITKHNQTLLFFVESTVPMRPYLGAPPQKALRTSLGASLRHIILAKPHGTCSKSWRRPWGWVLFWAAPLM